MSINLPPAEFIPTNQEIVFCRWQLDLYQGYPCLGERVGDPWNQVGCDPSLFSKEVLTPSFFRWKSHCVCFFFRRNPGSLVVRATPKPVSFAFFLRQIWTWEIFFSVFLRLLDSICLILLIVIADNGIRKKWSNWTKQYLAQIILDIKSVQKLLETGSVKKTWDRYFFGFVSSRKETICRPLCLNEWPFSRWKEKGCVWLS